MKNPLDKNFLLYHPYHMNFLVDLERTQLRDRHRKERDKRICDRIKAVLLFDKGWSVQKIAEALLLSEDAIRDHISQYKDSRKLKPENGGSIEKLSLLQSKQLIEHLKVYTYLYVKDIIPYVQIEMGVTYTVPGMREWLHRHGFSYKKPAVVPGKANAKRQQEWIDEYNKLKQELPKDETICFMDGVHPTHNVQPAYGWIQTGIRKEILTNTGRSRVNLSGAIDVINHNILVQEDKMLNAAATISFLKKIESAYPTKRCIHLFCDNARYYRNKEVTKYLTISKIRLHFLPPYSPNLNPIERLWKWMKERVIYNSYYQAFEDFKTAIFGFFELLSTVPLDSNLRQALKSRVRDRFSPINCAKEVSA
jgi:transposase